MVTNFSEDPMFNQIQGGIVDYLISMHKALLYFLTAEDVLLTTAYLAVSNLFL